MTNNDFIFWLKGYIEGLDKSALDNAAIKAIKNKLTQVTPTYPTFYTEKLTLHDSITTCKVCGKLPTEVCMNSACPNTQKIVC